MHLKKISVLVILFTLAFLHTKAQKNNYENSWKKVKELEDKGLPQSALKEVLSIYNLAKKENNDAQQIKACMFQIKYRNMTEEDNDANNIFFVDTLIAQAKAPVKNILQSMQAEMFWQFFQQNRWKFYNRTALQQEDSKDINTWSIDKLHATIADLYKKSLSDKTILQNTKLENFEAIIIKGQNTRHLRPTLYDFLGHRALGYFMNTEEQVTKPAYYFTINEPTAFAPVSAFINTTFHTKDTQSLQYNALLLLQDLLSFHQKDKAPDALIDLNIIRLSFVYQNAIVENKEKIYETALKEIEEKYSNNPLSARATYARAQIYHARGQKYNPYTQTDVQYEIKRAKELCEQTIAKFPTSEGGINCKNMLAIITTPSINMQTEEVNIPGQPFRNLITYKNVKKIYVRVIKTNKEQLKLIERKKYKEYDDKWKEYIALKSQNSFNINLPDLQDYQTHSTEIKVDQLNPGIYIILTSIDPDFSFSHNILAKQVTYVSNISYINNNNDYYVLNRDNGKPLTDAQVQVWERKYNYSINDYENYKSLQYKTDKNGHFKLALAKTNDYRNYLLQIKHSNDELFLENYKYYDTYSSYEQKSIPITYLFTDRSIYRPGQTIYFKGIVLKKEKDAANSKIMPAYSTTILLKDANSQKVNEIKVTTNEFGSFNGSFKLPENLLNGNFSLYDQNTNATQYFSVEEYKRPKFYVEIQKPKGTYKVNDNIQVSGSSKAYAGNNVDGAKVTYRVVRRISYPIWWGWGYGRYGYPYGQNEQVEIANGEAKTNEKGEFAINFKAIPDESVNKKDQPVFYYDVSADVTDINGETRSNSASVAVAYQMLQLSINMPDKIEADSLKQLNITSANMNGIHEKATVNVSIYKVQSPNKVFKERYWQMPDQFTMSKEEYNGYFPYDVYKDEDQINKWPLGDRASDNVDTTKENGQWAISNKHLDAGWYKIIATSKDKYGENVKAEKFIQLTDEKQNARKIGEAVIIDTKKSTLQPGEKINYTVKTGFDNVWAIHTVGKINKENTTSYENINERKSFEVPVNENDRGGISMNVAFIQHNRVYMQNQNFSIPWTNKELNISYQTFRDKLLPGAKESYTVKITGNKGDKVSAEILAGMYDASLDQYKSHGWNSFNIWPYQHNTVNWQKDGFMAKSSEELNHIRDNYYYPEAKVYDRLLFSNEYYTRRYANQLQGKVPGISVSAAPAEVSESKVMLRGNASVAKKGDKDYDGVSDIFDEAEKNKQAPPPPPSNNTGTAAVQVRKNFNETAFFLPDLKTDADGNVSFSFTIPEALTKWKLMTFAHTKDLSSGYTTNTLVTQKPLMVQPNAPRFMREGDKMEFSAKVVNLSEKEITGTAQLELLDATTNKPIDGWFKNIFPEQHFTIAAGQSGAVKFPIEIPHNFNSALTYRIIAKAGDASDGEEMALPVLTNRMLVTESLPLNLRGTNKKEFRFEKLINSTNSETISNHALTVEYTSNPAWYAVQSLPYLMEYPYECAEQTFNRYYANILATNIANTIPKIKAVFEKWKTIDTAALLSNIQKNEELKSALLQETPWVLEAKNENQQKKNIALLFDMVRMSAEADKAYKKLKDLQSSNGGFVWFKGGPDDRYMTQYILSGIGHLRKLNALSGPAYEKVKSTIDAAIPYLDRKIKEDYDNLIKYKADLKLNHTGYTQIQYLYMRSFFPEYKIAPASQTAYNYYREQIKKYWLDNSKYMQAMIALALHRTNENIVPAAIIKSLKENAIVKEEMGMYWKEYTEGSRYYWYQAPIETHAMMIEAFSDVDKNTNTVDDLKTWLLKQKQTQSWSSTKATAEACYALLLGGSNWLAEEKEVEITLGGQRLESISASPSPGGEARGEVEEGTGYFKKRIEGEKVKPEMGNIAVTINSTNKVSKSTSWGSVYWQYFEDLDKITSAETPLKLTKKLFIQKNTDRGPVLQAITNDAELKVGDKVKVRIELRADRDMEYVHMKDMRAACMEPTNVISRYKYQDGLGYYESTKDASTNFFFNYVPKGTYVFEYTLFVTHAGNFSNGITSIQCMYAPEFTAHSEGIRVSVAE